MGASTHAPRFRAAAAAGGGGWCRASGGRNVEISRLSSMTDSAAWLRIAVRTPLTNPWCATASR
eukprot:2749344-Prymnesium_polylepis.1